MYNMFRQQFSLHLIHRQHLQQLQNSENIKRLQRNTRTSEGEQTKKKYFQLMYEYYFEINCC